MNYLLTANFIISTVFVLCYAYQFFYLLVGTVKKASCRPARVVPHRYAVMISARNEEAVIGKLIESIRRQKYPAELVSVFVVADNCTDRTAAVAKEAVTASLCGRTKRGWARAMPSSSCSIR